MPHSWRNHVVFPILVLSALVAVGQQAPSPSADKIWKDLMVGNQRYVSGKTAMKELPAQRKALVKTQHPLVAVLSCSDSRVPPELVFDKGLGELFVVRTAGEDDDPVALGSLEYAVEHLGSTVILVMGHQSCGAVTAACAGRKSESENLEAVLDPIVSSCKKADSKTSAGIDMAIHDHIHSVAQEMVAKSEVIRKAVEARKLTIIEAYYSLETGEVTKLR